MTIELDDATAAVLLDMCTELDDNLHEIGWIIREAVLCLPALQDAFTDAGVDPATVERPEVPKLKPGRKYKPPTG
jgi:hypothetical protein